MTNYGEVDGDLTVQGETYGPDHPAPHVFYNIISPDTFKALHISLLQGRVFTDRDDTKAPPVAIINKHFAQTYFAHKNALGQRFVWMNHTALTVVGVVDDVRFRSFDQKPALDMYIPYSQPPALNSLAILLRSNPGSNVSVADLRNVVHNLDANIPLNNVQPLGDYLGARSRRTANLPATCSGALYRHIILRLCGFHCFQAGYSGIASRAARSLSITRWLADSGRTAILLARALRLAPCWGQPLNSRM
jgi:hypothetical protein